MNRNPGPVPKRPPAPKRPQAKKAAKKVAKKKAAAKPKEEKALALAPVGGLDLAGQIERMAQQGVTPEVLSQYMDVQDRHRAQKAKEEYTRAMVFIQAEVPDVVVDSSNDHTNSAYASLPAVQRTLRPILAAHGFSVIFSDGEKPQEGWVRVVATVSHISGHTETYHRDGPIDDKGPKGGAVKTELHGIQSSASYLRRKLLESIFGMVEVGDDDDGNGRPEETITFEDSVRLLEMLEALPKETQGGFWEWLELPDNQLELLPASRYQEVFMNLKGKLAHFERGARG